MAVTLGKSGTLSLDNSANTPTAVTSYVDAAKLDFDRSTDDVSVKGSSIEDHVTGQITGTLGFSGPWEPTFYAQLDGIYMNASVGSALPDYSFSPDGTTTHAGKFCLTTLSVKGSKGGAVRIDASGPKSGANTRS